MADLSGSLRVAASPRPARDLNRASVRIERGRLALVLGLLVVVASVSAADKAPRTALDAQGRLLIHGVPRFVLGGYDSGFGFSPDRAEWERKIFNRRGERGLDGIPINLYLNYHLGRANMPSVHALMDVLWKRKIVFLQTGNC